MAHERITSNDVAADVIVQWADDLGVVSLGLVWDDPQGAGQVSGAVERRVEGGPGGMISVPTGAEDASEPLQAYLDGDNRWSIYVQLDRPKLNGLIRTLRRARNKAFGVDE